MRNLKRLTFLQFILLICYINYVLISTGFFRTIEPHFEGNIVQKVAIKGAEDIMISPSDSFALISATNRMIYPPDAKERGELYWMDLKTKTYSPIALTTAFQEEFAPHGISFFKKDNGYKVMAINHTEQGHSIEVFELQDQTLTHKQTLRDAAMIQPNDLVMLDENRFYFTNDHGYTEGLGKLGEEYLGLALSNVMYFDGQDYKVAADGIAYANGINFDRKRNLLFVASPRHFSVKVYSRADDDSLTFIEDIPCGTGVDNIEFDEDGNLWIGAHPNLLRFKAYAQGKKETTPSEVIKITYRAKGDYRVQRIYVEEGEEM